MSDDNVDAERLENSNLKWYYRKACPECGSTRLTNIGGKATFTCVDCDEVIWKKKARDLHRTGVNCPECGDFLHNLGEMIKHKHDFDADALQNSGGGSTE